MITLPSLSSNLRRAQERSGFTLMELLIACTLGIVTLGLLIATTVSLTHSMVSVSNYYELDNDSRITLDEMSRDIRNASTVTAITNNLLSMSGVNYQGNAYSFTYEWDGSNVWRTYNVSADTYTTLMLSNCAYLCFSNYMRVPSTNFTFFPANGTNDPKLISVSWRCSRKILGNTLNTESVQTAKIVIRN